MARTRSARKTKLEKNDSSSKVPLDIDSDSEDFEVKEPNGKNTTSQYKSKVSAAGNEKGKRIKTAKQAHDVKPFYGFKCYFEQLITEANKIGSKMDNKAKQYMMETPFGGFFKTIFDGMLTKKLVQRCNMSIIDLIHMYCGEGLEFCFSEHGETVELKETTISCVFGIKMGKEVFDTHEKNFGKSGNFEEKYFKGQRISRKDLSDQMSKLLSKKNIKDEERLDLVKMLILYSFATFFFANTSGTVAKAIVKKFDDMSYVNRCCWPSLIHSYLIQSIQKNFQSNSPNVSGCVYALLYFFLEHSLIMKPIKGREAFEPRMAKWDLGEVTGTNWINTLRKQKHKQAVVRLVDFTETEKQMLGTSDTSESESDTEDEQEFVRRTRNKKLEIHNEKQFGEESHQAELNNENPFVESTSLPEIDLPISVGNEKDLNGRPLSAEYISDEVFFGTTPDMNVVAEQDRDGVIEKSGFDGACELSKGRIEKPIFRIMRD